MLRSDLSKPKSGVNLAFLVRGETLTRGSVTAPEIKSLHKPIERTACTLSDSSVSSVWSKNVMIRSACEG